MQNLLQQNFTCHQLDDRHQFWWGMLPEAELSQLNFEEIWNLHPEEYHTVTIHGKDILTPRWQCAYGKSYHFSGNVYKALPVPKQLHAVHKWCQENIFLQLNGLLLNWYDGSKKHYIGKHRDSTSNMIFDAPIVTISLGEERIFRMRPYGGKGKMDFSAPHGRVFVLPYNTNKKYTHEVPHFQRNQGRRLSITLRGFK